MKLTYLNILSCYIILNILLLSSQINIQWNLYNTTQIQKTKLTITNTRLLCECDLYTPSNYDDDQEMKELMQQFEDRTSQRFHKYEERMKTTRQKCREQCDKDIKKIILNYKIEKELSQKLVTLETNIDTTDISTCVCEKSLSDKLEKTCLRCGGVFGGGVMPGFGAIGGTALYALNQLKPTAIATAIEEAIKAGASNISAAAFKASEAAGLAKVITELKALSVEKLIPGILNSIFSETHYTNATKIAEIILTKKSVTCGLSSPGNPICHEFGINFNIIDPGNGFFFPDKTGITQKVTEVVEGAKGAAANASKVASERVTAAIKAHETNVINATYAGYEITIIASIIAILIIVLIMVIIYLILRYQRKKKMKKKLQYIKLLKE
ncbi:rifin [Plasmodium falciparum NF54]|uniref:Rifin n=2 Tax=Plasmodium falciparum TaxID=5833 RepID=Q8IBE2_PLAF7|nr:rifin [Plasmodium falciparum 3D7]EWC89223.1 hypothetical protein PFNF54_01980 [Plasmodium falciparum NF54]KAF4326952.1 rifin [Plasmodium falciparum NF54]PKC42299.1 rifin [Plasmodium falciparum NF54]CAD51063.1 rifin [Plasmodium falciparum 3D7]|eukprot:XP_001349214.1 rifin [Plasmodium falciparum 3D7]